MGRKVRYVGHGSQPPEWDYRVKNLKAGETVCGQSGTWHSPHEENNNSEIVKNFDNTGGSKRFKFVKMMAHLGQERTHGCL